MPDPCVCSTQVRSLSPCLTRKASGHANHRESVPRLLPMPYKAFLKSKGEVGEVVDYEVIQNEADARYRDEAIKRLLRNHAGSQVLREPPSLALAVKEGVKLILGAEGRSLGGGPAASTCSKGMSIDRDAGSRLYVPVLFSHRNKLTREDSLLAAFHGIVLAEALGQPVPFVKVVHGPGFSVSRIKLADRPEPTRLVKETRQILERLRKQVESTSPPLMILNSHCPSCEFRDRCRAEAVNRDDLSLHAGHVGEGDPRPAKTWDQHRDPVRLHVPTQERRAKRSKPLKRHLHALQALAVRDKKVYVVRTPEIPAKTHPCLSRRGRDYPTGISITSSGSSSRRMVSARLIRSGLMTRRRSRRSGSNCSISCVPWATARLFHYGSYEKAYIKKMLRKYPSPDAPFPGAWDSALFNVLGAIRTNVYFPAYSNGLKDIASFLGATWTGKITSGIDCIAARLRWEESRDPVDQGGDHRLQPARLSGGPACRPTSSHRSDRRRLRPHPRFNWHPRSRVESHGRFGKIEFAIPEMDFINKCARFNYQRDKVLASHRSRREGECPTQTVEGTTHSESQCRDTMRSPDSLPCVRSDPD